MEFREYSLPEWVFLDGDSSSGDTLRGRTVIQHVRSYTVMELIAFEEVFESSIKGQTFEFTYLNNFGNKERFMLAVHFTLAGEDDLPDIFKRTAAWFSGYMDWEDRNIIIEERARFQ